MTINASDIISVTRSTTKDWTRQRKAEERGSSSWLQREGIFERRRRLNLLEAAEEILPSAYKHASGDGQFSVAKRQLYYACRESFKRVTGRELTDNYFSNTLLVQYMNRHPEETFTWRITADPRGTLVLPNTAHELRIPCGTLAIAEHLESARKDVDPATFDKLPLEWPSLKPHERYQAVLYIEKEGFEPLLEEAKIAERYDLAILSCKGQSVVAGRRFVDEVCSVGDGVPLFVVHDFDKSGFEISQRLTSVSKAAEDSDRVTYRFRNTINVVDLGLRLDDVKKYGLASETVEFHGHFAPDSIASPEEQAFLRSNQRVELNAFTSPQFIEWLEAKLRENGLRKRLIPNDEILEAAFRRALAVAHINDVIDDAVADATRMAEDGVIPKSLRRLLQKEMKTRPDEAWDKALYRLAQGKLKFSKND